MTLPLVLAAVLVAIAVGLADPIGERCTDVRSLATNQLSSEAAARYKALLGDRSPTCAVTGLATTQAAGSSTQSSSADTTTASTVTAPSSTTASSASPTTGSATAPRVVIKTEDHSSAHTNTPPETSSPPSAKSNLPTGLPWIDGARESIDNLGLTTAGWALLGVAALLLLRAGAEIYVSRRPGVVDIGTVTSAMDAGELSANSDAVKAQLRQRFGSEHLFGSPLVPGGGLPTLVAGALKDVDEPATQWMASLLKLLPSLLPQSGVTIDATVRTRDSDPKCGCTLTVTDLASGRVLAIFTAWDEAVLKAVDRTSTEAIAFFLGRDAIRRRTPTWARFEPTTADALAQYVEGNDALNASTPDRGYAEDRYRDALRADPGNLTIALRLGNAQELRAANEQDPAAKALATVAALRTYMRACEIAKNAFAPRYRRAVLLDQCARLWTATETAAKQPVGTTASPEQTRSRADAIETFHQLESLGRIGPPPHGAGRGELWSRAIAELDELVRHAERSWLWKQWRGTFTPTGRRQGTRRYYARLLFHPKRRKALHSAYIIAALAMDDVMTTPKMIDEALDADGVGWQARYNAACFFARHDKHKDCVRANQLLAEVLRDPDAKVTGTWMATDPDLEALREPNWVGFVGDRPIVGVIPDAPQPAASPAA